MAAIEAANLRRTYRTHTGTLRRKAKEIEAVRGISFAVAPGELFGLLGPNGAGKTTTIKMLITLLIPTAGTARVLGIDVVKNPQEVRKRIGYVFGGERGVYERLSGYDNLRYFAELYGVPPGEQKPRIEELLELVELSDRGEDKVGGYSHGMRQRLGIAAALLRDPKLLLLDEPTTGLDPAGMRDMRDLVRRLAGEGITVLLSSHLLTEVEELCNRVAIIRKGRIVYEGRLQDLLATAATGFRLRSPELDQAKALVLAQPGVAEVTSVDGSLRFQADEEAVAALSIALGQARIGVTALVPETASLEELFLGMTEGEQQVNGDRAVAKEEAIA